MMRIRLACAAVILAVGAAAAQTPAPDAVVEPGVVADWLRQEEVWGQRDERRDKTVTSGVTLAEDAAGGVDGIINGQWGFHTSKEVNPWWQVDLGRTRELDRVVLYNRTDRGTATRNAHILVWLSTDGKNFENVYRHDGTVFHGHSDGKPLEVDLVGHVARFVRLGVAGESFFHLDEVEVYALDKGENIALNRPATQSSLSQWSAVSETEAMRLGNSQFPTERILGQGLRLADDLATRGVDTTQACRQLANLSRRWAALEGDAADDLKLACYVRARSLVRSLALANPLLDFEEILFVKRAPTRFPHMSDQFYGWWSRGGGGIYILSNFKGGTPTVRCLTEGWPEGNFLRPDLSYDGRRVLFAYCRHDPALAAVADKTDKESLPEESFYHVFEMDLKGRNVRQLTRGRYDDFDARYLPDGSIVFLSTRKGTGVQVTRENLSRTCDATLPDSFVRCGGDTLRPVPVFTLHRMEADGSDLRPISAFENFEWTPSVAEDGRVIYARWDYIDRFNGPFISLWSTLPDGRGARLVYGNYTEKPQCVFEAQAVPGSSKLMFTAAAHHSIMGGSIALLDRTRGTEYERPIERLTPQVCFPETEGWPAAYYSGPWPLSEEHFLTAWSDKPLPAHHRFREEDPGNPRNASGIYLADAFGNLNLLYRDPAISSTNPIPVRPRAAAPALPSVVDWNGPQRGAFVLQDVYRGLPHVPRGTVRRLRVIGTPPKVQPFKNQPVLGVSAEETGKFVLGTVPIESDGSAYFEVPSGVPVFFQALDEEGMTIQTMRSLAYVQPGETFACIGCHEHRDTAPPNRMPAALARDPSRLTPGPEGTWPLSYDRLVQPVLDRHCVSCHAADADDADAVAPVLTKGRSYDALMGYADGDLEKLAFEKDFSQVGDCPARRSKLLAFLDQPGGHAGVVLDRESRDRLVVWMDTYAQRQGSFSPEQDQELIRFRRQIADLLVQEP